MVSYNSCMYALLMLACCLNLQDMAVAEPIKITTIAEQLRILKLLTVELDVLL